MATTARVGCRFDSKSGTPGNANRTLPVLCVMTSQAELWDIRAAGSNPGKNIRRYKTPTRTRRMNRGAREAAGGHVFAQQRATLGSAGHA